VTPALFGSCGLFYRPWLLSDREELIGNSSCDGRHACFLKVRWLCIVLASGVRLSDETFIGINRKLLAENPDLQW
jgi:hypothetical protein